MALPHFDTVKDTGYLVRTALQSPPGKIILGAGSKLSWIDFFKAWCEVNKVPFGGYDATPLDVFVERMPIPDLGQEMGEMFVYLDEFGYTGGEEGVVNAEDVSLIERETSRTALIITCSSAFHAHLLSGRSI